MTDTLDQHVENFVARGIRPRVGVDWANTESRAGIMLLASPVLEPALTDTALTVQSVQATCYPGAILLTFHAQASATPLRVALSLEDVCALAAVLPALAEKASKELIHTPVSEEVTSAVCPDVNLSSTSIEGAK